MMEQKIDLHSGERVVTIDMNCDLGEGCPNDAALMPLISSANIACGYHAGDEATMRRTIELALQYDVAIGAHPGYRDSENFGRTEMWLAPEDVESLVVEQIAALDRLCRVAGTRLHHVKPHGALYNQAARDEALAAAIARAVIGYDPGLILYGLAGSESIRQAELLGLRAASEVFADRTYQANGSLTPRTEPNALIEDEETACGQVLILLHEGKVAATDGQQVPIKADTVCIHGDGRNAVGFATKLRQALSADGIRVATI